MAADRSNIPVGSSAPGYYSSGTVKIIPASAMRDQQFSFDPQVLYRPYEQQSSSYPQPINVAYYMTGGMYNANPNAYLHEPYGQNAYIDNYADNTSYPFYGNYNFTPYPYQNSTVQPGAYGPYAGATSAYRPYPQPQPSPPRRSRTAPNRSGRSSVIYHTEQRRPRGYSANPYDHRRIPSTNQPKPYFVQPPKKTNNVYKKRREPTINRSQMETDFGGGTLEYKAFPTRYYPEASTTQQHTLRRIRPYYAPSYATYPPSTMNKINKKLDTKRYPLYARVILKFAQLILGAAILGLVLGPMKGYSFHEFVVRFNTEWQGLVVGIVSCWGILTAILLVTCCLANKVHAWRKLDAHINLIGILAYLVASFLEAYYAACYPPNGPRINLFCHRAEWIIATILCFINIVLYVIDFSLSWFSGVTML
ncbi:unnamed protein product [Auanema sp. JU1783]|nr:unnamed protein product [Auanema sp. JU1783]